MFGNENLSSSRMGTLPDLMSIRIRGLKPLGKEYGRPMGLYETNAGCMADELQSSWWAEVRTKKNSEERISIESLAELRRPMTDDLASHFNGLEK